MSKTGSKFSLWENQTKSWCKDQTAPDFEANAIEILQNTRKKPIPSSIRKDYITKALKSILNLTCLSLCYTVRGKGDTEKIIIRGPNMLQLITQSKSLGDFVNDDSLPTCLGWEDPFSNTNVWYGLEKPRV